MNVAGAIFADAKAAGVHVSGDGDVWDTAGHLWRKGKKTRWTGNGMAEDGQMGDIHCPFLPGGKLASLPNRLLANILFAKLDNFTRWFFSIQAIFLSCPPPLVTKSGPDKGGGHDKIGGEFSGLKITHIFGYLPQKKVLFRRDWIPNFPTTRSDNFFSPF